MAGVECDHERPAADRLDVDDLEHPPQVDFVRILDRSRRAEAVPGRPGELLLLPAVEHGPAFRRAEDHALGWKNFSPLYWGGLWVAEIWIPPAAFRSRTRIPTVGVEAAPAQRTSCPVAVTPAITAGRKTDDETLASWLTTIGPGSHRLA